MSWPRSFDPDSRGRAAALVNIRFEWRWRLVAVDDGRDDGCEGAVRDLGAEIRETPPDAAVVAPTRGVAEKKGTERGKAFARLLLSPPAWHVVTTGLSTPTASRSLGRA